MTFLAQIRKAIAGAVVAGAGGAVQAITQQCGHPISWALVGVATLVALAAVYQIPNAPAAPPKSGAA